MSTASPSSLPSKEVSKPELESKSFLNNWAVHCSTLPPPNFDPAASTPFGNLLRVDPNLIVLNENNDDDDILLAKRMKMKDIVKFVEGELLPNHFEQILEETIFALLTPPQPPSSSSSVHDTAQKGKIQGTVGQEYLAMQRLEKFFNGLADASRRGSRKALSVIYDLCAASEKRQKAMGGNNCDNNAGSVAAGGPIKPNKEQSVSATKLIDLSYRLSLASLVIGMIANGGR